MQTGKFFRPRGWQSGCFKTSDGRELRYGRVVPDKGAKIKGTVMITTGYGGFTEGYYETIHDYLKRGYAVYAMDWYGHGKSQRADPNKPLLPEKDCPQIHVRDLHEFMTRKVIPQSARAYGRKPLILSTHSMGGMIGLHYLRKHKNVFDAAVMAAPMVDIGTFGIPKSLAKAYIRAMNKAGFGDTPLLPVHDWEGRLRKVSKQLKNPGKIRMHIKRRYLLRDPGLRLKNPTFGWLSRAFCSIADLNTAAFLQAIDTPVLIGIGKKDKLVDNKAVIRAAALMDTARAVELPRGGHFLWTEEDESHAAWWKAVDKFVEKGMPEWRKSPRHRQKAASKIAKYFEKCAGSGNKMGDNKNPCACACPENTDKPVRPDNRRARRQKVLTPG